jgi:uncharacterized protein (DUF1778 family)
LDFRLDEDLKKLIEQAAGFLGQSVSAFAVSTLAEKARQVVEDHTVVRLSDRDRDKFLATLEAGAEPNRRLKRAAARHRRSVAT